MLNLCSINVVIELGISWCVHVPQPDGRKTFLAWVFLACVSSLTETTVPWVKGRSCLPFPLNHSFAVKNEKRESQFDLGIFYVQ